MSASESSGEESDRKKSIKEQDKIEADKRKNNTVTYRRKYEDEMARRKRAEETADQSAKSADKWKLQVMDLLSKIDTPSTDYTAEKPPE